MNAGSLRIDADGAVPRDGGRLFLTNSAVIFTASHPVTCRRSNSTVRVTWKCSGTWKAEVVKSGTGELVYDSLMGAGLLDVRGGTVRFNRSSLAGLNEGTKSYGDGETNTPLVKAAYTDTPYLMLTNAVTKNMPRMERNNWNQNELVTYAGYIWNTNAPDVTWTWHVRIDDASDVVLDGERVISQAGDGRPSSPRTSHSRPDRTRSPCAPTTDRRVRRVTANHKFKDSAGTAADKRPRGGHSGTGMVTNSDYYAVLKDPGDGTLFTTRSTREVHDDEFAPGTGVDFDDMPYTLEHLIGLPDISNGDLTVTGDWVVDGAELAAGGTSVSSGKLIFANGATLKINDILWGEKGRSGMTFLTAVGGIEGMPVLEDIASRYHRRLVRSADGKSLTFYATRGCVILVR